MKKKRVMACLLSGAMAVGMLSGCGGGSGSGGSSDGGSSSASTELNFWFPTYAASDGEMTDEEFWRRRWPPLRRSITVQ